MYKVSKNPLVNLIFQPKPFIDYFIHKNKNAFKNAIKFYNAATKAHIITNSKNDNI
jgi:hypothetical protein